MRHTSHILLGADSASLAFGIRKHVLKYGETGIGDYFRAFLYPELDPTKDACFQEAELVPSDDNVFVAGIDEQFEMHAGNSYDVLASNRSDYLKGFFRKLYDDSITINKPGDSSNLHLLVYVPLYRKEYWSAAESFLDAIDSIPQGYHVDLFLFPYDTAFLFEKHEDKLTEKITAYAQCTKEVLESILEARRKYASLSSLVMLQNCNSNGTSLDLDEDSLVRITGEFALLSVKHYPEMFQPSAMDEYRPIHALGLSVLSFDKFYFVQYLLHRSYAYILDRENVSQEEVDVNKVSQIVQGLLSDNVNIFSRFYDEEISPRLNRHINHAEIISQIGPRLNEKIADLTREFQSYIDDPELSLPEKKATLAQLLGEDDDLLTGYMFNKRQLVIDDCSREVLDLFVNAHNRISAVMQKEERFADYAVLSKDHDQIRTASDLLDDLKEIKVKMRACTNFIRQKSIELQGLDVQRSDHNESFKRLTNEGFVFEGHTYRLQGEAVELDLEEVYSPVTTLAPSVDLRKDFTAIKNQGEMGACTAFALVSIFEYILKKNQQPDVDLSEQFVYFNSRKNEGSSNIDSGSSLSSIIDTMKKQGICQEHLFPYNPRGVDAEPPVEAFEDALSRKVVCAKAVNKELHDIKSAVYEGYPVAVTLEIFNSFDPQKGFIRIPDEEEIRNEKSGAHTMVICGYNDEARYFVVRNSWGREFGDKGYCYIPYGYLENNTLLDGACIITEISDTRLKVKGSDQKTVVSFDLTDSNIKSEILNNVICDEKLNLQKLNKDLKERSLLFNSLFQLLGNNDLRETLSEGTQERLDWECGNLTKEKDDLQNERIAALNSFDATSRRYRWLFWGGAALVLVGLVVACIITKSLDPFIRKFSFYLYGVVALVSVFFWLVMRRRKRMRQDMDLDYKDRLEHLAQEISIRQREKEVTHLKTHLAGMIIDSLYKLGRNLNSKYNAMRSCVGNLKVWREQEKESLKTTPLCKDPFLTMISNDCLDDYFENNKEMLTDGLELSKMFKDRYSVKEEEVVKFKNELKGKLMTLLFKAVDDFSIFSCVTKARHYPFIDDGYDNIGTLLQELDFKSTPFVRLNSTVASTENINTHCKIMFLYVDGADRRIWEDTCGRFFNITPQYQMSDSPFKITLLQLKGVAPNEVSILN